MTYDLGFTVRAGATVPTVPELKEFFATRKNWTVEETRARYINEETSIGFRFSFRPNEPEEPAARVPLDFTMGQGPHTRGLEAEQEVRAVVERFSLLVNDPQMDGMGEGEFVTATFLSGYAAFNKFSHKVSIQMSGQQPKALSAARLEAAWRWNLGRAALAERSGDAVFVPKVQYAEGSKPGTAETFVAWAEGLPARVPEVDLIQGALGRVPWTAIAPALELAKREEDPLPHYLFDAEAAARVAAAIQGARKATKPLVILQHQDVSTAEMVADLIAPPKAAPAKPAASATATPEKQSKPAPKAKAKEKPKPAPKAKAKKKPKPAAKAKAKNKPGARRKKK